MSEVARVRRLDWREYGSVSDAITTIVGDHYGLYGRALPLSTNLDELSGDPLDHLEVLIVIEELFTIRLTDAVRGSVRTLGDLVRAVEGILGKR